MAICRVHVPRKKIVDIPAHTSPINILQNRTLADVQKIIKSGKAKKNFIVGDYFDFAMESTVNLAFNSIAAGSTWRTYIIGIDHNAEIEGHNRVHFCIGRDSGGVEIRFASTRMDNSAWNSSSDKTLMNGALYNALPADLRNVITECVKYTNNVGNSAAASAVTATSQKIWAMAEFEVFGSITNSNSYEKNYQAQYDYYKLGNSKVRIGHTDRGAHWWWLRSPYCKADKSCCVVLADGTPGTQAADFYWGCGMVPCFTIS